MEVIVLNADYKFHNVTNWKKAFNLVLKNKADVLKYSSHVVKNFEKTVEFMVPHVVRLKQYVKMTGKQMYNCSKKNILIRDNYTCQYCGGYGNTMDHVIPKSKGGKFSWTNIVCACQKCNNIKKNDRTPEQAGLKLLKQPKPITIFDFINYYKQKLGIDKVLSDFFETKMEQ